MSILFSRIAIIALAYCFLQDLASLSFINKGIGLHGGLLHITNITQVFHIFVFIISILILQLTSFYPRKVWVKEHSSLSHIFMNNLVYYRTKIINKMGDHLKIIEYPLILLFVVCGAIFLMSTNDLVSIFLSIELQSYGLYLLSTIYRNSELATTGGLMYFLLGGLSSCFIVRLCAICYYESKRFRYYPYISPATELGEGESPTSNIASLFKVGTGRNQMCLIVQQAESSMSRARLPESNSLGTSTWGLYHFWDRIYTMSAILEWRIALWIIRSQDAISIHNVKSWDSKEDNKITIGTKGLPTALKSHGNRGIVVPLPGRIPGISVCMYSTTAGGSSTVSTDGIRKIQKIRELCVENKEFIVTDKLYKILYDKELYYAAYNKLKSKPGNMTPGIVPTTLDGISVEVIEEIIQSLKDDTFKFQPGRRVMIPKASGGERPLTIAPPRDKLVQECIRMILEAIYEPSFDNNSHGFRPNRSCHSALRALRQRFVMAKWFIEGDISQCFPSIDHEKLMSILAERIKDQRFLGIIRKALKAGYMEFRKYSHSVAGTPQGSIISPILANIYLSKLDAFVANLKEEFDVGKKATIDPVYKRLARFKERAKSVEEKLRLHKLILKTPSKLNIDPNFKKLEYIRYADDWIIGVRGSREDCASLMEKIRIFLKNELKLELSETKTKITNASKEVAEFLSVRIRRSNHITFSNKKNVLTRNVRNLRLTAPIDRVTKKLTVNGFMKNNSPYPKFIWMQESKDAIILLYNSVYRGIIQYYRFADNFNDLSSKVHYILKNSCARLLTAKFKANTQGGIYAKYGKNLKGGDKHGFVNIVLGINTAAFNVKTDDVLLRLQAKGISKTTLEELTCSVCDSDYRVEMHHIRMMKDLNPKSNLIDKIMARKNRKQIPLCRKCHMEYHNNTHKHS
jgi:group II intron reverse transcriptase/maturase